jgi:hypothetical protein
MKTVRHATLAVLLAGLAGDALAFHAGGVAACEGCHTMHGSADEGRDAAGAHLLQAPDASSVCLNCHAGTVPGAHHVLTIGSAPGVAPVNLTPGGDFAWLGKSFAWRTGAKDETSPGERHGHDVVAADYGLLADPTRTTSPGGTFPADRLACTSCHDPHGRWRVLADGTSATTGAPIVASGSYGGAEVRVPTSDGAVGAYRLLAGQGYASKQASASPLTVNPPAALAPPVYNQSERTADVRVAYGAGMSEWCGNCHGALHTSYSSHATALQHPSGPEARLSGLVASVYNAYIRTGDLTGSGVTSYTSLVPYEEGTTERAVLATHASADGSMRDGPGTGRENVMCLTCHRAHASGWDHALRWNSRSELLVAGGQWPGVDATAEAARPELAQGRTTAETRGAMYDRDPAAFATFQTTLCNKCHSK